MSSSSFTVPADPRAPKVSQTRTLALWVVLAIWAGLMGFAVISIINPPWLQAISAPGRDVESRDIKDIGDNFLRNRQFQRAANEYVAALKIRPDFPDAMTNLAIALGAMGNYAEAERYLQDALKQPKARPATIRYQLGELAFRLGKHETAVREYQRAIEAGFDPDVAWRRIGAVYNTTKRYPEAIAALEECLRYSRAMTTSYRNMLYNASTSGEVDSAISAEAKLALDLGVREEALAVYDTTLIRALMNNDTEISKVVNDIGFAHLQLGDSTLALERMKEAVLIWPGNTQAQTNVKLLQQLLAGTAASAPK